MAVSHVSIDKLRYVRLCRDAGAKPKRVSPRARSVTLSERTYRTLTRLASRSATTRRRTAARVRERIGTLRKLGLTVPIASLAGCRARKDADEDVARHEAAHVVVAMALGITVWIAYADFSVPLALNDGGVFFTRHPYERGNLGAVGAAGDVALPGSLSVTDATIILHDRRDPTRGPDAAVARARQRAGRILHRYAGAVDVVAQALLRRKVLGRVELQRLLRRWPALVDHEPSGAELAHMRLLGMSPEGMRRKLTEFRREVRKQRGPGRRRVA